MNAAAVDHLVVAAATLAQGVAWCEATFGAAPAPGGSHPRMGTHNRLLAVSSAAHPRAYLEIIAIDPDAAAPAGPRWFDLDAARVQEAVRREPRLVHFVARTDDAAGGLLALRAAGFDGGAPVDAERATPGGTLRWRIGLRPDGCRPCGGLVPTLIEWGRVHPADQLPPSGVELQALEAVHPHPGRVRAGYHAIGLEGVRVRAGAADLVARFVTAAGPVVLHSGGG